MIASSAPELLHRAQETQQHTSCRYLYYIVDVIKEKKIFYNPTNWFVVQDGLRPQKKNNSNTLTGMGTPVQAKSHWSQESGY